MEKQITINQSKSSTPTTTTSDEIKNPEIDKNISIEKYQYEHRNQQQQHQHQNQTQQQQQQQHNLQSEMDKNLCISNVVDDNIKNSDITYTDCLESTTIPSSAATATTTTTISLQQINITKDNQLEPVLQQPNNNNNTKINLMPITSDMIQSLKSSLDIVPLSGATDENKLIQRIQNLKDILTTSVVMSSASSSTASTLTSTASTASKTPSATNANVTKEKTMIEITRKESESLKQNNNDNINVIMNNNINKNNNENDSNTNNKVKEENANESNEKNISNNNNYYNNIIKFTEQQEKIPPIQAQRITTENKMLSAVCITNNNNNENNESKSECYNNNSNKKNQATIMMSDDDMDVITISSTDENLNSNNSITNIIEESLHHQENLERRRQLKQKEEDQQQLTEKILQKSMNLQRTHSKTESVLEYLNSVEPTVTIIQEKLIDLEQNPSTTTSSHNGSSSIASTNLINDSESEEDDQLKPLMQDNHTIVVNHEFYVYKNSNSNDDKYQNLNYNDIISNKQLTNNTINSCSSTDSDLSTQFDHRDLSTVSHNSLEDYQQDDSGLDTLSSNQLSFHLTSKYSTHHLKQLSPVPPAPATTPVTGVPIDNNTQLDVMQASQQQQQQQQELQSDLREIDTLAPMEIPDDKLCEDIVEHVEYYFSNDNILKDAFLLKHVRRNKEGFVSLKLVSSFKRVRQFTKDWRVVGNAIERKSKKIEINDIGTKIRRIEELPNFDETMPSRTIVVCDLPFDKLSISKITDIFSKCGEIALIRILRPGMQIPVDVRQFMNKYPEMQQKECALVEFIDSASARFAKSMPGNYKVFDMVAPKKKTGKKSITTITKFIENYKYPDSNYERTRGGGVGGGTENMHHHHYNHSQNFNYNNGGNQQHHSGNQHHNHYNHNHNQVLQNINTSSPYDNEFRSKLRSNYDVRSSQLNNHESQQLQNNYLYQPPQRRFSASSDQENNNNNNNNNNREHIQNMNSLNNQIGNNNNNSNIHFSHYPPRRMSNSSVNDLNSRKFSSCSEGYSSCSDYSRRQSLTSSQDSSSRKTSTSCSEYCPCSRRTSQCSDVYRKISHTSDVLSSSPNPRRFSNGSFHGFERQYSNPNDHQMNLNNNNNNNNNTMRRISFDSNYDRKMSSSSINGNNNSINSNQNQTNGGQQQHICDNHFRKFSNGFDPNRKLSFTDQYFNGRRISTDSGYDRKLSFSSDTGSTSTSPRSRTNSFILPSQYKTAEILVRTPIGPDGSKGFASRGRKFGSAAVQ